MSKENDLTVGKAESMVFHDSIGINTGTFILPKYKSSNFSRIINEVVPLNLRTETGDIKQYIGIIEYSTGTKLMINIKKEEENLNLLHIGTRFIIGDIFPRAYVIEVINEYPTTDNVITDSLDKGCITIILALDITYKIDNLEEKLADNTCGIKTGKLI